jgi:hypothetical protein
MTKPFTNIEIIAAWKHVVPDTLVSETEGLHAKKQTVEIRTRDIHGEFDGQTRRIATSDLFQCFWTADTKVALDAAKRSAKRQLTTDRAQAASDRLQTLDSMWAAQSQLCNLDHPRIHEARAKLAEEAAKHEERKAKPVKKAKNVIAA